MNVNTSVTGKRAGFWAVFLSIEKQKVTQYQCIGWTIKHRVKKKCTRETKTLIKFAWRSPLSMLWKRCRRYDFSWIFYWSGFLGVFSRSSLTCFSAYAPVHIWWNNTVIHPSGIFISGKAQPCYEIQLNSHFCHINWSHFFHHFCFSIAGCSVSTLTIWDEVLVETYTAAESLLSLKSTLQRKQGSQGHSALIRNTRDAL